MTRRGWSPFIALGIIWGMPYLRIRIAVESPRRLDGLISILATSKK